MSGSVFRLAEAGAVTPNPVALGNIREGESFAAQALTINNTAANDGFSESLNASVAGQSGDASGSGNVWAR